MFLKSTLRFGIFWVCLFACFSVKGESLPKNYVLVINSYEENAIWPNYAMDNIRKSIFNQMELYQESLQMLLIENEQDVREKKKQLLEKYNVLPRCIVLLGGSGWAMFEEEFSGVWKDVPVILCAQEDYIGPLKACIEKYEILPEEMIPLSTMLKDYNVTVIRCPIYVRETIEEMKSLLPGMEKLVLISDNRYISAQVRHQTRQVCQEFFPTLQVDYFKEGEISMDAMLDSIRKCVVNKTGILYYSWFQREVTVGNKYISLNNHKMISSFSKHPVFTLEDVGIQEGEMAGGYFCRGNVFGATVSNVLKQILSGKEARSIPWQLDGTPRAYLCYNILKNAQIPSSLYPDSAVYYFAPEGFWSKYRYMLLVIVALSFIIYLMWSRMRILKWERGLREKELFLLTKYKTLFNNMPLIYMKHELVLGASGEVEDYRVVEVNPMFEKCFAGKDAVIGKTGRELSHGNYREFLILYKNVFVNKRSYTIEYYHKLTRKYYEVLLISSVEKDMVDVFCVDVTDLRETKSMLESVNHKLSMSLDVANITPWRWDLDRKTILCDVNRPIELQHVRDEDVLSVAEEQYFIKIHKDDRERVEKAYLALIHGDVEKVREEYRVLNNENHHFSYEWVEAQATVDHRDDDGKPLSLVGSSVVITGRKNMEIALREAKECAEESNRLKSAFLANMSHEIRTPLNAIVGFSNILASAEEEDEKKEYVNIIENNNTLLLQLISDILDLSKIESGSMEFSYSSFNLNAMLHELEQTSRLRLKSDAVVLEFENGLPECCIHSEKNRLTQLVSNLINNAIKFTSKGKIRFGYHLVEKKSLYFYVSDTGCGIASNKKDSVFGRFVKLNTFAQGTGLGLSICKTIVERMGGQIGVDSEVGEGSTFWFTIPYLPVLLLQEKKVDTEAQQVVEKSKVKLLVAEDNSSNYMLFESILKKEYHLIHAWNGREAVELFKEHAPHLILMDINMPELNGFEAVQEIRQLSSTVPIIAVTAYAYASDEEKIMEGGFDGYAVKPIDAKLLKNKISTLLAKRLILL